MSLQTQSSEKEVDDLKSELAESNNLAIVADSATIAKNTFLANVGHELRTPLHNIMGSVDILLTQKDLSPEEQKNYFNIIKQKSQDLLTLVNDLLDISKIEAGKLSLHYETVKFKNIIKEVSRSFENDVKIKNIKYNYHIDKNIPRFLTIDSFRLKQILINLIGNAIKFTNNGTIDVFAMKITNEDIEIKNKIELEFCISDTGIGIPKHKQSQLFKPFSQVQDVTQQQYGGTGLGLAISKRLAEMMDGKIWDEDNVPKGTRFCFTIVAKRNEKKIYPTIIENVLLGQKSKETLDKRILSLLIVEDDAISLDILKSIIREKSKNIVVAPAYDGQQAVEIYTKQKIDMILTDIQMPKMDGYSMIQQIRAIEKDTNKHILILAMTASGMPCDKEKCLKVGADYYITKPVIKEDLYNNLDKMIVRL